jgi:hypothetical protein
MKFAYQEIASHDLEPRDGFCEVRKILGSIMLQMRIPLAQTTVYKFLKSLKWCEGRTTLTEFKRVIKIAATEKKAYMALPRYQELLCALEFTKE